MEKTLLLVDDEPQLLFAVREYLSRSGYDVVPAESGSEALSQLLDRPPDLIISDIMMAEMDGFELQQRVSALTGDAIPFIFLTAKADLDDRLMGLRGGADDYVTKPFEPEELEARIAAVLSRIERTRREEQREVDTVRSRVLGEIGRRLRVPVTSLMAHLNLLLDKRFGDDEAEVERYLASALDDATVLCELVNDLSWAAAQRERSMAVRREPVRIAPVVRRSAASAAKLASSRSVELSITCGGLLSGNIDSTAIGQALSGLLDAAVELSPAGSIVEIAAYRAEEGGIEFIVTDGGCSEGGRQDRQQEMADALDLARRVVEAHDGQLGNRHHVDGRHSYVLWIPGRVAKHVGRRN